MISPLFYNPFPPLSTQVRKINLFFSERIRLHANT